VPDSDCQEGALIAMPFAIELSDEISHRHDLALLANARGYKDAVEIGTDQGIFAREFLNRFNGHWLICVDPYAPFAEWPYDRTIDLTVAAAALAHHHGRFRFIRRASPDAIPLVLAFCHPDIVYIDGSHEEDAVRADLEAWWDVLPSHGMLAGHDYDDVHPGVVAAVNRFARERGVVVRLTVEDGVFPPTYYIYRTEPPTLIHRYYRHGESANPHAARGG
jgi:hypothetical protein